MTINAPSDEELAALLGDAAMTAWDAMTGYIRSKYDMESFWESGGRKGSYVREFRKSGKTLCTLNAKKGCFDVLVIFGKTEQKKFEALRQDFSPEMREICDNAATLSDGKQLRIPVCDGRLLSDIGKMLNIKKQPEKITV